MHCSKKITVLSTILALSSACSDDGSPGTDELGDATETGDTGPAPVCDPGEVQACTCADGWVGEQTCLADGSGYGECGECVDPDPPICGDAMCEPDEDCSTCADDCGICLDCSEAPSCEGAAVPGVIETHLEALDVPVMGGDMQPLELAAKLGAAVEDGNPGVRMIAAAFDQPAAHEHPLVPALRDVFTRFPNEAAIVRRQLERAGMGDAASYRASFPDPKLADLSLPPTAAPEDCEPAKLRMRVAKIIVHDESDLVFKDNVYCAIVSEAGSGAEIRVTPKTSNLDTGQEYVFALAEGVVWGQLGEPVAPLGNMLVTYNCLESDNTGGFEEFLDAIADAALGADPIPGAYGWIVPVVGLAAEIIGAALALETDDHLFNASQVIPAELQLEMTQGVWWSVERNGTFMLKNWHWELRMEAWGCTDDGVG